MRSDADNSFLNFWEKYMRQKYRREEIGEYHFLVFFSWNIAKCIKISHASVENEPIDFWDIFRDCFNKFLVLNISQVFDNIEMTWRARESVYLVIS